MIHLTGDGRQWTPTGISNSPTRYTKYTYAVHRRPEKREQRHVQKDDDPQKTVVLPLTQNHMHFALAEDGILHSRIVSPPRSCFAPIVVEVKTQDARLLGVIPPDSPWERVCKHSGLDTNDLAFLELDELTAICSSIVGFSSVDTARVELEWKRLQRELVAPPIVSSRMKSCPRERPSTTTPRPRKQYAKPIFSEHLAWRSKPRVSTRR